MRRNSSLRPLSIASLAVLASCSAAPQQAATPIVLVASATTPRDSDDAAYTGVVRARIESVLSFRVGGKIVARLVDAGQSVRAGQPLFRIDASDLGLAASAARDRVRAAEADAIRTAADENRLRGLVETGSIAASAYDGAKASRDAAAATLAAARANAANAANERRYATLFADADGTVTEVLAEPSQVVAQGTPVVRLARSGAREAVLAVPETKLAMLPRTAIARLYGTNIEIPARLREVAGSADPVTRTFAARFVLEAPAPPPLGVTVTVTVPGKAGDAVEVPLGAVIDQGRGPGLWLVDRQSRVTFKPVPLLRMTEETALVPATLVPVGTRVVAMGGQLLRANQRVRTAPYAGLRS